MGKSSGIYYEGSVFIRLIFLLSISKKLIRDEVYNINIQWRWSGMEENNDIRNVVASIQSAMELPKCRKCGCMKESLETMKSKLLKSKNNNLSELLNQVEISIEKMESIKYT